MRFLIHTFIILLFSIYELLATNVILVMADDQGWGQTGYYNHPILKTPHLDRMAKNGLRFDRFYAGGPVCSPTRATVLTGRTHDRTGVLDHGYPLRKQEMGDANEWRTSTIFVEITRRIEKEKKKTTSTSMFN